MKGGPLTEKNGKKDGTLRQNGTGLGSRRGKKKKGGLLKKNPRFQKSGGRGETKRGTWGGKTHARLILSK